MRQRLAILLAVLLLLPVPAWGQGTVNARIQDSSGDTINATSGRLHVDGSGVTQPVSGTVSVSGSVAVTDGGGSLTVDGTVNVGNFPTAADTNAVAVRCVNAAGTAFESCAGSGGSGDGIIRDGSGAGQADVIGSAPGGTEQGLVVRNIPSGTQTVTGTVTVQDGGGSITVDGTVGVSGTVTVDSELPAAAALADNTSNPTVPGVGAFGLVWDGSTWDRLPGNATDGVLVNLGANNDVTVTGTVTANQGGTWNIGTVTSITNAVTVTDGSGPLTVDGTVGVSGTVATNVAQVGGTSVTTGVGSAAAGTMRVAVARDSEVCNPIDTAQVAVAVSASGNTELVPLTSGQTIYVCDVLLVAGGTVDVQLIYGTGTACATGETDMTGAVPLVANTGYVHNFNGRLKTAASTALCLELSGAVSVQGTVTYRKF